MLKAASFFKLETVLAATDISVKPRGEGRTTPETETWIICRFLSTLGFLGHIEYPVRIGKSERPDFVMAVNGFARAGIEVTEVVHQDFAKLQTLPEAQDSASVLDRSLFRWGEPRRSLEELREIASRKQLSGPGWGGYEVEQEFASAMMDRIRQKTRKLGEEGYSRFPEDWLLIYENLMLPSIDLPLAISYLRSQLPDYFDGENFSRIFIESGRDIVELSKTTVSFYKLRDLW